MGELDLLLASDLEVDGALQRIRSGLLPLVSLDLTAEGSDSMMRA